MIHVAVIGAGNMGSHHARVYSQLPGVKLVAVSDVRLERAQEMASKFGCKAYGDFIEMIEKEKLDGISIVVPTKFHTNIALECIRRGKNLLIEKPIADTTEHAEAIIQEAKKHNVKLLIGHIERHNPAIKKLKEVLDSGKLGKIVSISAKRVGLYPPQITDVNVVADLAIHDIDIINYLLGREPDEVFAHLSKAVNKTHADCAEVLMKYNGTGGLVQVNWVTPVKIRQLSVTGTAGYVEVDYISQKVMFFESKYERKYSDFGELIKLSQAEGKEIPVEKEEPLKVELSHFVACLENKTTPLVTAEDGLKALRIALKISDGR